VTTNDFIAANCRLDECLLSGVSGDDFLTSPAANPLAEARYTEAACVRFWPKADMGECTAYVRFRG
jgi:hypothetical protein